MKSFDSTLLPLNSIDPALAVRLAEAVEDAPATHRAVIDLKNELIRGGANPEGDLVERTILMHAAAASQPRLNSFPVDDSVKQLLQREYAGFAQPARSPLFVAGEYTFAAACKMATLRRFPAGAMDWELSGFPRSWLLKTQGVDRFRALWFLATKTHGFAPMFYLHVARFPRNRLLILEDEVEQTFVRIVRSMRFHPEIKGILASAWFFDAVAVRDNPHLAWINRPFRRHGGLVVMMGPADEKSGLADHNAQRRARLARGDLHYRLGTAIWPREAAFQWLATRVNAPTTRSTAGRE